jgi:tetratricopeptide (TPR) repeat protein
MTTAEEVLQIPYPSYHASLEIAREWTRSEDKNKNQESVKLLKGLFDLHPYTLEVGQELVLALLECGNEAEAKRVLMEIDALAPYPNEEVLCRWGRLYKDNGDRYVELPVPVRQARMPSPVTAAYYYRRALEKYDEAYEPIRSGHYPGINKATLLLILGTLPDDPALTEPKEPFRQGSEDLARELLARRKHWPIDRDEDIHIWHPATEAEANLLLRRWDQAARLYREAQEKANIGGFHSGSMRKQVARILHCFTQIGVNEFGSFQDLDAIFPPRPPMEGV